MLRPLAPPCLTVAGYHSYTKRSRTKHAQTQLPCVTAWLVWPLLHVTAWAVSCALLSAVPTTHVNLWCKKHLLKLLRGKYAEVSAEFKVTWILAQPQTLLPSSVAVSVCPNGTAATVSHCAAFEEGICSVLFAATCLSWASGGWGTESSVRSFLTTWICFSSVNWIYFSIPYVSHAAWQIVSVWSYQCKQLWKEDTSWVALSKNLLLHNHCFIILTAFKSTAVPWACSFTCKACEAGTGSSSFGSWTALGEI